MANSTEIASGKASRVKIALVALNEQQVPPFVTDTLAAAGIALEVRECVTRDDLRAVAYDADIVWSFGDCRALTADNLDVLARCKAIIRSGSGLDKIPVAEATARRILVVNTPAAIADAVSDHAIALLFAVMRQIPMRDREIRAGKWARNIPALRWHLTGQTVGLIGFGHIGRRVAAKLQGFAVRILVYDPFVGQETIASFRAEKVELEPLLRQSDFVSIHCPLTPETRHLLGARELGWMKPNAILINTARGAIVDQAALIDALRAQRLGGAGLDVFDPEPLPADSPLLQLPNVVVTPHIAAYADNSSELAWRMSLDAALELAQGRVPDSTANRKALGL